MGTYAVTMDDMELFSERLAKAIRDQYKPPYLLIGIPRGGIPVAYAIASYLEDPMTFGIRSVTVTSSKEPQPPFDPGTIILVDDIEVTGKTLNRAVRKLDLVIDACAVIVHKPPAKKAMWAMNVAMDTWVEFPWEAEDEGGGKPLDAVTRLIEYMGDDPTRDGLLKTPERFLKFLDEKREELPYEPTTFKSDITDLQVESGIPFSGLCEHHMLPYWGTASIGYIPNGKLLGLSKLVRCLTQHSQGLTMQELVTAQTASQIAKEAGSSDVAVVTTAQHTCMVVRGVKAHGSNNTSSAMLGKFRDSPALRAEFMRLAGI